MSGGTQNDADISALRIKAIESLKARGIIHPDPMQVVRQMHVEKAGFGGLMDRFASIFGSAKQ